MDITKIFDWLAPILSTLIVTAGVGSINMRLADSERRREADREETQAKRDAEAKWRDDVVERLDSQDERIDTILTAQCSQMRSDLIHRAHRYVDDLGCASTEEKESFWAEYEEYVRICDANDIVNHFIDNLAKQVMALPNRDYEK